MDMYAEAEPSLEADDEGYEEHDGEEATDIMTGWSETTRAFGTGFPVSALAYDSYEELLWAGFGDGRISSFLQPGMQPFTSLLAHPRPEDMEKRATPGGAVKRGQLHQGTSALAVTAAATAAAEAAIAAAASSSHAQKKRKASRNGPEILSLHAFDGGLLSLSSSSCRLHSRGMLLRAALEGEVMVPGVAIDPSGAGLPIHNLSCAALNASSSLVQPGAEPATRAMLGTGGSDARLLQVDLYSGLMPVRSVSLADSGGCTAMVCGAMLVVGGHDGKVRLLDGRLKVPRVQHTLQAHTGPITALALTPNDNGLTLATVGHAAHSINPFDKSAPSTFRPDAIVRVFDLRMPRQLQPLQFAPLAAPTAAAFLADAAGTLVLTSATGQVLFSPDPLAPNGGGTPGPLEFYQLIEADGGPMALTALSVAGSGTAVAIGSAASSVAQLVPTAAAEAEARGHAAAVRVNLASRPTEVPPFPAPPPPEPIHPLEETGYGAKYVLRQTTKQLYTTGPLSSSFATSPWVWSKVLRRPPAQRVSPLLLEKARRSDYLTIIPNPGYPPNSMLFGAGRAAYQVCDPRRVSSSASTKTLAQAPQSGGGGINAPAAAGSDAAVRQGGGGADAGRGAASTGVAAKGKGTLARSSAGDVPVRYQRPLMQLGKRGIDGFDFSRYNKTLLAGLERTSTDSYINPVLTMLFCVRELRDAVMKEQFKPIYQASTVALPGLACELGFLFHQLAASRHVAGKARTCQATNFLRCFQQMPEALALGLLTGNKAHQPLPLPRRLESFHRFLLSHADKELAASAAADAAAAGNGGRPRKGSLRDNSKSPKKAAVAASPARSRSGAAAAPPSPGGVAAAAAAAGKMPTAVDALYGYDVRTVNTWLQTGALADVKAARAHVTELVPPEATVAATPPSGNGSVTRKNNDQWGSSSSQQGPGESSPSSSLRFSDMLRRSLFKQTRARAWNSSTSAYAPIVQQRVPQTLPAVMAIHCAAAAESATVAACLRGSNPRGGTWLPEELEIVLRGNGSATGASGNSSAGGGNGPTATGGTGKSAGKRAGERSAAANGSTYAAGGGEGNIRAPRSRSNSESGRAASRTPSTEAKSTEVQAASKSNETAPKSAEGIVPRAAEAPSAKANEATPKAEKERGNGSGAAGEDVELLIVGERVDPAPEFLSDLSAAKEEWYYSGGPPPLLGSGGGVVTTTYRYRLVAVVSRVSLGPASEDPDVAGMPATDEDENIVLHAAVPRALIEEVPQDTTTVTFEPLTPPLRDRSVPATPPRSSRSTAAEFSSRFTTPPGRGPLAATEIVGAATGERTSVSFSSGMEMPPLLIESPLRALDTLAEVTPIRESAKDAAAAAVAAFEEGSPEKDEAAVAASPSATAAAASAAAAAAAAPVVVTAIAVPAEVVSGSPLPPPTAHLPGLAAGAVSVEAEEPPKPPNGGVAGSGTSRAAGLVAAEATDDTAAGTAELAVVGPAGAAAAGGSGSSDSDSNGVSSVPASQAPLASEARSAAADTVAAIAAAAETKAALPADSMIRPSLGTTPGGARDAAGDESSELSDAAGGASSPLGAAIVLTPAAADAAAAPELQAVLPAEVAPVEAPAAAAAAAASSADAPAAAGMDNASDADVRAAVLAAAPSQAAADREAAVGAPAAAPAATAAKVVASPAATAEAAARASAAAEEGATATATVVAEPLIAATAAGIAAVAALSTAASTAAPTAAKTRPATPQQATVAATMVPTTPPLRPQAQPPTAAPAAAAANAAVALSKAPLQEELQWVIVNDFRVEKTVVEDARSFLPAWKSPCILLYRRAETTGTDTSTAAPATASGSVTSAAAASPAATRASGRGKGRGARAAAGEGGNSSAPPSPARTAVSASVFDVPSLSKLPRATGAAPLVRLPASQLPSRGDVIAIDAEFVTLELEAARLRPDGSRVVLRQARQAPARVSLVDGRTDTVIMDDYVVQTEPVVDYLTRFSGITPEDLDPTNSRRHLSTLRSTYLKLRCLLDRGCIFVGHGLSKDFRILNLTVPDAQVVDTVELWSLPSQRKASLRFLAHFLLGTNIQGETHDSVEDAKVALALYRHHREAEETGRVAEALRSLYEYGWKVDWKVTESSTS